MARRLGAERTCIPGAAHSPADRGAGHHGEHPDQVLECRRAPSANCALLRPHARQTRHAARADQAGRRAAPAGLSQYGTHAGPRRQQAGARHAQVVSGARPSQGRRCGGRRCPPGSARGSRTSRSRGRSGAGTPPQRLPGRRRALVLARRPRRTPRRCPRPAAAAWPATPACAPRPAPVPVGRWCSSTRRQGRRSTRSRGQRVQRQRQRGAGVVDGQHVPAGLVVDDDQVRLIAPRRPPVVQPVDAAGHGDQVGPGGHRALHADRLAGGIEAGHVLLDHLPARAAGARPTARRRRSRRSASRTPAGHRPRSTVRSRRGSRHQPASALCTLAPRLLWAHGGPLGGGGRSR